MPDRGSPCYFRVTTRGSRQYNCTGDKIGCESLCILLIVIFIFQPCVGNSAILKGGKESAQTTAEISRAIQQALGQSRLDKQCIQTVQSREEISSLLELDKYIDLVIPR